MATKSTNHVSRRHTKHNQNGQTPTPVVSPIPPAVLDEELSRQYVTLVAIHPDGHEEVVSQFHRAESAPSYLRGFNGNVEAKGLRAESRKLQVRVQQYWRTDIVCESKNRREIGAQELTLAAATEVARWFGTDGDLRAEVTGPFERFIVECDTPTKTQK